MPDVINLAIKADSKDLVKASKNLSTLEKAGRTASSGLAKSLKVMSGALVVSGIGLGVIINKSLDVAKNIRLASITINESAETIQKWQYAASKFGIEADKVVDIFKDMNDRVGDFARTGAGPLVDVMEQTNLKIEDLIKLRPADQLQTIFNAIDNIQGISFAEKTFFLESFAGDASRLIPLLEKNGLKFKELADKAEKLNIIMSDLDVEMLHIATKDSDLLSKSIGGLAKKFTVSLAPAISGVTKFIDEGALAMGGWGDVSNSVVSSMVRGLAGLIDIVNKVKNGYGELELLALKAKKLGFQADNLLTFGDSEDNKAKIKAVTKEIILLNSALASSKIDEEKRGTQGERLIALINLETTALKEKAQAEIDARKEANKDTAGGNRGTKLKDEIADKGKLISVKDAMITTTDNMTASLARETYQLELEKSGVKDAELALYAYDLMQIRVGDNKDKLTPKFLAEAIARKKIIVDLKDEKKLRDELAEEALIAQDEMILKQESFIDALFEGKDAVKAFFEEMILGAIKAQAQLALFGENGTGGILSGIFSNFGGFMASGGTVSSGTSYVVGEKGAEVFTPSSSGTITPNDQLGGGAVNITYSPTINADSGDTANIGQLLAEQQRSFAKTVPSLINQALLKGSTTSRLAGIRS